MYVVSCPSKEYYKFKASYRYRTRACVENNKQFRRDGDICDFEYQEEEFKFIQAREMSLVKSSYSLEDPT